MASSNLFTNPLGSSGFLNIHNLAIKVTLNDGDEFVITDSQSNFDNKKVTFNTLKNAISSIPANSIHINALSEITSVATGDEFIIADQSDGYNNKKMTYGNFENQIANITSNSLNINGMTAVTTLASGDELVLALASGSYANRKIPYSSLESQIANITSNSLNINGMTADTSLAGNDEFVFAKAGDGFNNKKVTFSNLKSEIQGTSIVGLVKFNSSTSTQALGDATIYVSTLSTPTEITLTISTVDILKAGKMFVIKEGIGGGFAGTIKIVTENNQTIDNGSTSISLTAPSSTITLISDGSNLFLVTDENTSTIQKALTSRTTIDVYNESSFGDLVNINGVDYWQLRSLKYVIHGVIQCTHPLMLPTFSNIFDKVEIVSDKGALLYTGSPSDCFICGISCCSLVISNGLGILGSLDPSVLTNRLFDLQFNTNPSIFFQIDSTVIQNWFSLGRIIGSKASFTNTEIAEYNIGLAYQGSGVSSSGFSANNLNIANVSSSNLSTAFTLSGSFYRAGWSGGSFFLNTNQVAVMVAVNTVYSNIDFSNIGFNGETPVVSKFFCDEDTTKAITNISASTTSTGKARITVVNHSLSYGANIQIIGTANYNGQHNVIKVIDLNNFDIDADFTAAETTGDIVYNSLREYDVSLYVRNCGTQKSSANIGSLHITNNTTSTSLATLNTFVQCVGATTASSNIERWTAFTNFRLRYNGVRPFRGTANIAGRVFYTGGNSDRVYQVGVFINNTLVTESLMNVVVIQSATGVTFSIVAPINVKNGDEVTLRVQQISGNLLNPVLNASISIISSD